MIPNYTDEQKAAIDISKHISVQANAGSGKTSILVDRYFRLLLEKNVMPRQILAITFTKKAAAEMKSRIIKKIEKSLTESIKSKNSSKARKLRKIREELTKSKISTIHSFCSGILRDYPIEARVMPNFTELDEIELLHLKDDAINDALEEYMDEISNNPDRINLLDQFQINELIENLATILDKSDAMLSLHNLYADKDKYIAGIKNYYEKKIYDFFTAYIQSLEKASNILNNEKNLTANQSIKSSALELYIQSLKSELENKNISGILNTLEYLFSEGVISKTKGNLNGITYKNKGMIPDAKELLAEFEKDFKEIIEISDIFITDNSSEHFDYLSDFYSLSLKAYSKFDSLKEIKNGVSFDDMIIRANEALKNDNIKKQLTSKYKYIMVDEFQDTNQIQYELIRSITGEFNQNSMIKNNLYIVGDAKQSIYRFRNADVKVFMQAGKDIADLNRNNGNYYDDEYPGNVNLTYTFRLFPVVADFINKVCNPVFSNNLTGWNSEYEASYDDLQFGKTDEIFTDMIKQNTGKTLDQAFGKVDYLFSHKPADEENENPDISYKTELKPAAYESNKIAEYINSIVNNENHLIFDDELNDFRKINFGDITILSRKKSNFAELQSAFLSEKIPVIINSGTGFYATQEIMDFTSFIQFLYDNSDDIALASILKAEFFAVDDTELFKIAAIERNNTFWNKFCTYIRTGDPSKSSVRAYEILNNIIPASKRISISGIIDLITENTGWYAIVKGQANEMQKIANVKKLRSFAISFQNRGFKSLHDFAGELTLLADNSKEGEAGYIKEANAVNVMTIHMSKGLEFPVVIIYGLNSASGSNALTFDVDKDNGIFFKYTVKNDNQHSIISKYIEEKLKAADAAEEKRVLYVAMTRAKYRLCLSVFLNFKQDNKLGSPKGLFRLFAESFDELISMESDSIDSFQQMLNMNINCLNSGLSFENCIYDVSSFKPEINNTHSIEKQEEPQKEPYFLIDNVRRNHSKEMFSPTKLQVWQNEKENPDEMPFTKKYLLGLKEDEKYYIDSEAKNEIHGPVPGTIIHEVLESMAEWTNENCNIDYSELVSTIKYEMSELQVESLNLYNRIYADITSVMNTDFIKKNLKEILNSKFEYSLNLAVGNDIIFGVIDLLFIDKNGNYEIWDWKTNFSGRDNNKEIFYEKLRNKYELQMKIYSYFIYKLLPNQEKYPAKLLLTMEAVNHFNTDEWIIKYEWNQKELEEFGEYLKKNIEEIKENHLYSRYLKSEI